MTRHRDDCGNFGSRYRQGLDRLDCPECEEEEIFYVDLAGYCPDEHVRYCPKCGVRIELIADEDDSGWLFWYTKANAMDVKDVGQPRCDGSCGCAKSIGMPCVLTCDHAAGFRASVDEDVL